jgi:hypothetical protein
VTLDARHVRAPKEARGIVLKTGVADQHCVAGFQGSADFPLVLR